jgi:predicted nucleotidyltransferase
MDLSAPTAPLVQGGTSAVLGVLAGTSAGLTGRTVARLAGLSHAGAGKILTQLVEHGMVLVEPVGAANVYRLNREHLLVGPALEMLQALDRLETRLGEAIRSWSVPCAGCALFGSAARRDGTTRSDLDVLVLRPDTVAVDDRAWRAQLDDTASQVERWTGNTLSWVEFDTGTFTRMITTHEPLIGELRRDAHWLVAPTPPVSTALATKARSA